MAHTLIRTGTSGFAYREWRGSFYPAGLPSHRMLSYYASRLSAVEINASFYRMPRPETLQQWASQVPTQFRFTFKAPGLITHRRQLAEVEQPTADFLGAVSVLMPRLGPLLFQLPPWLPRNIPLLEVFIGTLGGTRSAFEFRHASWFQDEVYGLLERYGCALCISDRGGPDEPSLVSTAPFGYLRLRREHYDEPLLDRWRSLIHSQGWEEVYVFFRHEQTAKGTRYAEELANMEQQTWCQ